MAFKVMIVEAIFMETSTSSMCILNY